MEKVLLSGKATFGIEVPYNLIDIGEKDRKPLIIYLHGFKQNISSFRQQLSPLLAIEAYHLFVQGPYPIYDRRRKRRVEDWGRAWYLYDGEQDQFVDSLEQSSAFLEDVLESISGHITVSRTALVGYSMGGYLAGYFGLSRYKRINDLIVVGGRIKTEVFEEEEKSYDHLNVLALHGKRDKSVESLPQETSCKTLSEWGANVTFIELDEEHGLTDGYLSEIKNWFFEVGYA